MYLEKETGYRFTRAKDCFESFCLRQGKCNDCKIFREVTSGSCIEYFEKHMRELGYSYAEIDYSKKEVEIVKAICVLVPACKEISFVHNSFEQIEVVCNGTTYAVVTAKECPNFFKLDRLDLFNILNACNL